MTWGNEHVNPTFLAMMGFSLSGNSIFALLKKNLVFKNGFFKKCKNESSHQIRYASLPKMQVPQVYFLM